MKKHIVSFSGGKDSTAMLLLMLENNMPVDEVVFFDTGWEFPEMYEHIKKVEKYTKIKIQTILPSRTFNHYLTEYIKPNGNNLVGKGWPQMNLRWCTGQKIDTFKKYANSLGKHIIYEGIAFDEVKRIKKKGKIYPLVELKYTEDMALKYCYDLGFDWGGLYKYMTRVSCYCCPLQRLNNLRAVYKLHPELWFKMIEMDNKTHNEFRNDYSLKQLTKRFEEEKKQMKINF